ncbi:MAG: MBL fold metallo-hydrolase [Armatimonadota bacterium]
MPGQINIRTFSVGPFETNCYIVWDSETLDALVIDPGGNPDDLINCVDENRLSVKYIINTHGHADHIAANGALHDRYGCPIIIHEFEADYLTDPQANLSELIGYMEPMSPKADLLVKDGSMITVGHLEFTVIHTPGHTPGGICLLVDSILFSGDTLFAGGIGRTDFSGGSYQQIINSILTRLLVLPDDVTVYPGHGPKTNIGKERNNNPWLQL